VGYVVLPNDHCNHRMPKQTRLMEYCRFEGFINTVSIVVQNSTTSWLVGKDYLALFSLHMNSRMYISLNIITDFGETGHEGVTVLLVFPENP